jgi:hypothetical protein
VVEYVEKWFMPVSMCVVCNFGGREYKKSLISVHLVHIFFIRGKARPPNFEFFDIELFVTLCVPLPILVFDVLPFGPGSQMLISCTTSRKRLVI